jgi:hypothetical protein
MEKITMTQHVFITTVKQQKVSVLMGWDRPFQQLFARVAMEDQEAPALYCSDDDAELWKAEGGPTVDLLVERLARLEIALPPAMIECVKSDVLNNAAGNRINHYS